MAKSYEVLAPVEIPGWGQVKCAVIADEITDARWQLEAGYNAWHWLNVLKQGIQSNLWGYRTQLAMDLFLKYQRLLLDLPMSEDREVEREEQCREKQHNEHGGRSHEGLGPDSFPQDQEPDPVRRDDPLCEAGEPEYQAQEGRAWL